MLVKVASFIFQADFMVHDCEVDFQIPISLGRPFLTMGRVLVDMEFGHMKLYINDELVTFNVSK